MYFIVHIRWSKIISNKTYRLRLLRSTTFDTEIMYKEANVEETLPHFIMEYMLAQYPIQYHLTRHARAQRKSMYFRKKRSTSCSFELYLAIIFSPFHRKKYRRYRRGITLAECKKEFRVSARISGATQSPLARNREDVGPDRTGRMADL